MVQATLARVFGPDLMPAPRKPAVTREDYRAAWRRRFSTELRNIRSLEAYWSPSMQRLFMRMVNATKRHRVPEDAVLVGIYEHPCDPDCFVSDLEFVIGGMRW